MSPEYETVSFKKTIRRPENDLTQRVLPLITLFKKLMASPPGRGMGHGLQDLAGKNK